MRGKLRRGPLWRGRCGKFERGMVGFVAAGRVRLDIVRRGRSGEVGHVLVVARCVKAGEVR